MRIIPTADNVALEKRRTKEKGKIFLPDSVAKEMVGYWVVDVGPDVKRCKTGDQVAYNASTTAGLIKLEDGKEFVVMSEKDIVGVIVA
jgi:co-chaperonin GroES (HSP10)